ncbi:3-beta hydroxysteroid dehydrogenase [Mycobacterium sp. MS1601]|uniref:SDR family oxidoreductase n=1 Tax=Mycobacterium sp. MS1601 TaxID=1936029 RepID=UPI0009797E22|nr:NAD(P)H-binding protein [Mycobacterium sp. MS1601]AQA02656.1 3-beta hydroxysteroid dehydrogenase [Mycobacterium sp. MS1601]
MKIVIAGATGTVGRHVVAEAGRRGHDVVALSRNSGQDVTTGAGLTQALTGADVVIDVSSQTTMNTAKAVQFFTDATRNLHDAERANGVGHHLVLSIVGIDAINTGYYAGKVAQEKVVMQAQVPWTIMRATQFHEFVCQALAQGTLGPVALVPKMLVRTVAAAEVAQRLVDLAEAGPCGCATDLVGPRDDTLMGLVRKTFAHDGVRKRPIGVALPGKYWRGVASGVLRGTPGSATGDLTFDQWLDSPKRNPS